MGAFFNSQNMINLDEIKEISVTLVNNENGTFKQTAKVEFLNKEIGKVFRSREVSEGTKEEFKDFNIVRIIEFLNETQRLRDKEN